MPSNAAVARALSAAFLTNQLAVDGLVDRGSHLLGRRWPWLRPLARRVCIAFGVGMRPRELVLTRFLLADDGFLTACREHELQIVNRLAASLMTPVSAASEWELPAIRSPGELADWLGITVNALDWYADLKTFEYKRNHGPLRHYHYRALEKGLGKIRLIEAPKQRLKSLQRRVLTDILDRLPPHAAVHGFRRGRSIKSFAAPHSGRHVVLRIDLEEFFPSISVARIRALFRTAGYPERVADLLAGLCTNATPDDIWANVRQPAAPMHEIPRLYARPHLPQGAPTSPALANLCAYRLDCRLASLADSAGAVYTRYADDLAFSGGDDFARAAGRFQLHACAIAMEEGFRVQHRKTRIMRPGVRQRLAGMVVNDHLNVSRTDYDQLKATLTNCVRHGPETQNRTGCENFHAHLVGRVSFVEMVNPARGQRLRTLLEQIKW
jgi:hypothetical protein